VIKVSYLDELYHHGIKGQRWGVRRYQNPDGTLTARGRKRYLNPDGSLNGRGYEYAMRLQKQYAATRNQYNALTGKRVSTRQAQPMGPKQQQVQEPYRANDPHTMTKQQLDDAVSYQRSLNAYNEMFNPVQQKKASVGKRFIEHSWSKVIEPSLTKAAQKALETKLKQEMGKRLGVDLTDGKKKKKGGDDD
jgi:hypothetical protein